MAKWYKIPDNNKLRPFTFIVGGRGIGKTYSAIDEGITNHRNTFLYLRNTREQLRESCGAFGNPFKKWAGDHDRDIRLVSEKNHALIKEWKNDGQHIIEDIIGSGANLSTFENLRGVDLSETNFILFDEFIENRTLTFDQFKAFLHMYETVNRNRELKGCAPVQLLCLANANDITNPVFESLNLIRIADRMQKKGTERWTDDKRGIQLIMLQRSPISRKKSQTVLYNLTEGSGYSSMAIGNSFNVDRQHIRPRPLSEYVPVCLLGELCIYRHKSEPRLYCTTHQAGVFSRKFGTSDTDVIFYRRVFCHHWEMYIQNQVDFEDVLSEKLFLHFWE